MNRNTSTYMQPSNLHPSAYRSTLPGSQDIPIFIYLYPKGIYLQVPPDGIKWTLFYNAMDIIITKLKIVTKVLVILNTKTTTTNTIMIRTK